MGKKIKKAVKKVTSVVKKAADPGGLLTNDEKKAKEAPAPEAPTPAQAVETPKEDSNEEGDKDTEAARKAARARGKRGLSVARSSGTGLNI